MRIETAWTAETGALVEVTRHRMSREKYLLTLLCDSLYWDGRLGEYVTENDLADVF